MPGGGSTNSTGLSAGPQTPASSSTPSLTLILGAAIGGGAGLVIIICIAACCCCCSRDGAKKPLRAAARDESKPEPEHSHELVIRSPLILQREGPDAAFMKELQEKRALLERQREETERQRKKTERRNSEIERQGAEIIELRRLNAASASSKSAEAAFSVSASGPFSAFFATLGPDERSELCEAGVCDERGTFLERLALTRRSRDEFKTSQLNRLLELGAIAKNW